MADTPNLDRAQTEDAFRRFEAVRQSGVTNMFDVDTVAVLSGLTRDVVLHVMTHYAELRDSYI